MARYSGDQNTIWKVHGMRQVSRAGIKRGEDQRATRGGHEGHKGGHEGHKGGIAD